MHPTDVRALICLLDAGRSGTEVTAGRLGAELGLNSAGTTSLIGRLERLGTSPVPATSGTGEGCC